MICSKKSYRRRKRSKIIRRQKIIDAGRDNAELDNGPLEEETDYRTQHLGLESDAQVGSSSDKQVRYNFAERVDYNNSAAAAADKVLLEDSRRDTNLHKMDPCDRVRRLHALHIRFVTDQRVVEEQNHFEHFPVEREPSDRPVELERDQFVAERFEGQQQEASAEVERQEEPAYVEQHCKQQQNSARVERKQELQQQPAQTERQQERISFRLRR